MTDQQEQRMFGPNNSQYERRAKDKPAIRYIIDPKVGDMKFTVAVFVVVVLAHLSGVIH